RRTLATVLSARAAGDIDLIFGRVFWAARNAPNRARPAPERRPCLSVPPVRTAPMARLRNQPQRFSRRRLLSRGAAPVVAFALLDAPVLSRIRIGLLPLIAVARSLGPGVFGFAVLSRTRIGLLPLIAVAFSVCAPAPTVAFARVPRTNPRSLTLPVA